ncbi:urate oxidase [Paenibacillus sp. IB182496]|uniref:Uricase n=2 Tax=Paenibacillus sabuli TaxID=2772509 RepID=A0A927GUM7_9BACL|nr:urate oxidase [Paenibacillus sabuli]
MQASDGRTMYYGKDDVFVYRTYARPLTVRPIPESTWTGEDGVIFAHRITFAAGGDAFFSSFAEGDNARIVATDSMKNFILRQAAAYDGATTEGLLAALGRRFLDTYAHVGEVKLSAERLPFEPALLSGADGPAPSGLVYRASRGERLRAELTLTRIADGSASLAAQESGLSELRLIKVSGSSFQGFIRDAYTTLPDSADRPLHIELDVGWRYADPEDALDAERGRYVAAAQVRDLAQQVFHARHSPSIQHLIWQIGLQLLRRFAQLEEVRFTSANRTWEAVVEPDEGGRAVYTEPRPPYGFQGLSMTRADLRREEERR